ncbi:MAG TPA: 16S rRNA (cytidine(1402)-2'-O)-methyltransferase [Thermotogota bacterium]|nr:16S rRNA (cytidine(1402)-2'-O)-methyltransferase [Thermotogota bacterium]
MSGTLFVTGTPIGNLQDISFRAIETLKKVDVVVAEDTRRSLNLLNHYALGQKKLVSLAAAKERGRVSQVLHILKEGQDVALLTDAGMPGIADPGALVVEQCHREGIRVEVIPGASAVTAAFAASGFRGAFVFEGFLPRQKNLRRFLRAWATDSRVLVCFESPFRLRSTLEQIGQILGNREVFIAREMTKVHQQWFRGTVQQALEVFVEPVKGELTLVLEGAKSVEH